MAEQEVATGLPCQSEAGKDNTLINFNPDTPNVLTGFGVDIERLKTIVEPFIGKTINQFIFAVLNAEISIEEKITAIFECGCKFGEQYAIRQLMTEVEHKEVH